MKPYLVRVYFDEMGNAKHLLFESQTTKREKIIVSACGKTAPPHVQTARPRLVDIHRLTLICRECEEERGRIALIDEQQQKEFDS